MVHRGAVKYQTIWLRLVNRESSAKLPPPADVITLGELISRAVMTDVKIDLSEAI
jgi:hypothetical protein